MRNFFIAIICLFAAVIAEDLRDFNTKVMNSTFKIQGEDGYIGTAFLVGVPLESNPEMYYFTIVTARHVFDGIKTDYAVLYLREKRGDVFYKRTHRIQIRNNGKNLYYSHPTEDVAVINIPYPADIKTDMLFTDVFATDKLIEAAAINPGDEVFTYGYPLGFEYNNAGFPLLRSGRIASYPIIPSDVYKTFFLDIEIFQGNSGGPVVFSQDSRIKKKFIDLTEYNFIMGLVSEETFQQEHIISMYEEKIVKTKLSVATIVQSRFILETIEIMKAELK
ncbi:MAG: serine protease [Candidatus Delongbacteria bacterium]|nr:serine protease [Candidatus Delongbacteria bacterium]MDD4205144.1 serine protease [Candidatus Delongbacteria bacterium]